MMKEDDEQMLLRSSQPFESNLIKSWRVVKVVMWLFFD